MNQDANDRLESQVFRALADPTRRALLTSLQQREQSVSELTSQFDMTQSAVSQHLRVLREARIVSERKVGRLRLYEFHPEPLLLVKEWLEQHVEFWVSRFENLGEHLRKTHAPKD